MKAFADECRKVKTQLWFRLGYKGYKVNGGKVGRNRLNQCCRIEERRIQRDNPIIEERVFGSHCCKDFKPWNYYRPAQKDGLLPVKATKNN